MLSVLKCFLRGNIFCLEITKKKKKKLPNRPLDSDLSTAFSLPPCH